MSAIKFRKRLTKFKITIALPKKSLRFEEALVNLIEICIPHTPGDIAIQKREIDYIKIKIVSFIINFGGNKLASTYGVC